MGYRPLQAAVADYLRTSRGVAASPEQVAIVSGLQEALDLVGRVLLDPGDKVCMEDPGYMGAALVFEAHRARYRRAGRWRGHGAAEPRLRGRPAGLRHARAPGAARHQHEPAQKAGPARVGQDDRGADLRGRLRQRVPLRGPPAAGPAGARSSRRRSSSRGSFNKVLFPSLRLGYLVVPPDLVDVVAAARSITARHAPLLDQAILCDFIVDGHFGRHIRRMREIYAERRSVLLESARERLAGLFEIVGVEAGLQTAGWLLRWIARRPPRRGPRRAREVEVTPLDRYSRRPDDARRPAARLRRGGRGGDPTRRARARALRWRSSGPNSSPDARKPARDRSA